MKVAWPPCWGPGLAVSAGLSVADAPDAGAAARRRRALAVGGAVQGGPLGGLSGHGRVAGGTLGLTGGPVGGAGFLAEALDGPASGPRAAHGAEVDLAVHLAGG